MTGLEVFLVSAGFMYLVGVITPDQPSETIVLLPDDSGTVGMIAINPGTDEIVLDQAGQVAFIGEQTTTAFLTEDQIASTFGDALSVKPEPARSFILYFKEGTTTLAEGSEQALTGLFTDLEKRSAPEITVIGHTDRVGSVAANDRLALQRAEAVRSWLVEQDVPTELLDIAGRGEREPLIDTADGVEEPLNRRVEINVR